MQVRTRRARRSSRAARTDSGSCRARDDPRLERAAVVRDIPGFALPHALHQLARKAMLERLAQWTQPERIAEDVGVDRDVAHERVLRALLCHFLELVDEHVAELATRVLAVHDLR